MCSCQAIDHCAGLSLKFHFILSVLMDISLKIILVDVHTDDLCSFGKFMYFCSNLSGAERNTETEKQITLCICDHVRIAVSIRTSDTAEVQRMVIAQHGFCKDTCNNRNLSFLCEMNQLLLAYLAVYSMSEHNHRALRLFQRFQNCIGCLLRCGLICMFILEFHVINRILYFTSLNIHRQVDKNRASSSCRCNVISLI